MYSEFYLPNSEEQKRETDVKWCQVDKRDKGIHWPFQVHFEGPNMRLSLSSQFTVKYSWPQSSPFPCRSFIVSLVRMFGKA